MWFIYLLLLIIIYFCAISFEVKERRNLCEDVEMWCNIITQLGGGSICISLILRGDNLQILPRILAMVRLSTHVIWKQRCASWKTKTNAFAYPFLTITARPCVCWERRLVFLATNVDQNDHKNDFSPTFTRFSCCLKHLYSEMGGHHVVPTFHI